MNKNNDFVIRTLTAKDIFPMAKIISKCGISDLKRCFTSVNINGDFRTVGINVVLEIVSVICSNIGKCEKDIMHFLSDLSGIDEEDIEKMLPAQFAEMIKIIIKKEEFQDFFTVLSESFSQVK